MRTEHADDPARNGAASFEVAVGTGSSITSMPGEPAIEKVLRRVSEATGSPARAKGSAWVALCPAHEDHRPSLSVGVSDRRVLVHCHAGCAPADVLAAAGLTFNDLNDIDFTTPLPSRSPARRVEGQVLAEYEYTDERGDVLFVVQRRANKRFVQKRPDGAGGWIYKLDGVRRVPFHLPELLAGITANATIYVVEGEKDVLAVEAAGGVATCNPGGAGKWRDEYTGIFNYAARVVIVADRDEPGRRHAATMLRSLARVAASVSVVEAAVGKDASDHLAAGRTLEEFAPTTLVDETRVSTSDDARSGGSGGSVCQDEEDGWQLLDAVMAYLDTYVAWPSGSALIATTLWVAHTHAVEGFESTPRAAFLSPEKGSGKTRVLECLEVLVPAPMLAVNATPAALFRAVGADPRPTVLFDEIDTIFGPNAKTNEELRGLLNAGHRRGAVAYRCVGEGTNQQVLPFPAFAAVALAGLGNLPDTILDRSVVIRMRRRAPHERVEAFRRRDAEHRATPLRERLRAWAERHKERLADARPVMPPGVTDRPADVWEPLLALADVAGGSWPELARTACVDLLGQAAAHEPSLGVRLLADLRQVFEGATALSTEVILDRLNGMEQAPWADLGGAKLNSRGLARLLRPFEVKPVKLRVGNRTVNGYRRPDLHESWIRYLPTQPLEPVPLPGVAEQAEQPAPDTSVAAITSCKRELPDAEEQAAQGAPADDEMQRAVNLVQDVLGGRVQPFRQHGP